MKKEPSGLHIVQYSTDAFLYLLLAWEVGYFWAFQKLHVHVPQCSYVHTGMIWSFHRIRVAGIFLSDVMVQP